jgi:ribosomal protein S24E
MKVEIVEKRENPFFSRNEIRFRVEHEREATPSREKIREEIAKALDIDKDRVILIRMRSHYGRGISEGEANVYQSKKKLIEIEPRHLLIRNKFIAPEKVKEVGGEARRKREEEKGEEEKEAKTS